MKRKKVEQINNKYECHDLRNICFSFQQFRKIKWALQNSRGKKKRKFESKFSKLVSMAMAFWWKMFPERKQCHNHKSTVSKDKV